MKISQNSLKAKPLKVLLICPHIKLPGTGGAATHHTEFSKAMSKKGVEIHILADISEEKSIGNILFHKSVKSSIPPGRFFGSLFSIRKSVRICKEYNIDVIHDRCDPGQITGFFASKLTGIPRVAEINYNFLSYEIKMSFLKDKILYPILQAIKKQWIKKIVKSADYVGAVSNSIKDSLIKHGLNQNKIEAIPNGADPERFSVKNDYRTKFGFKKNDFILAVIGELGPRQNILQIIKSAEKSKKDIPEIKLVLAGGDERYRKYISELKDYVSKNKLEETITFAGKINNDEVPAFLSSIDVALAPYSESWGSESFGFSPIKIFEYMAASKIVVASDTEWTREIIGNWKDGILSKDFDDLGNILLKIKRDKRMKSLLEKNSREKITQKFTWEKNAEKYIEIYKKLINE